ncbi:unnamed protein product, partial [Polarella glacialis]
MRRLEAAPSAAILLVAARRSLAEFDAVHVVACLRRLAVLKASLPARLAKSAELTALVCRLRQDLADGSTGAFGAASAAWSAATLGPAVPALLEAVPDIAAACARLAPEMTAQGLATSAWSLAVLELREGQEALEFLKALRTETSKRLLEFQAQDLAFTVWSFATLECSDGPLLEAIAAASMLRIDEFKAKGLSNTAWAFAMLGVRHRPLMAALASQSAKRIHQFHPDDLANTASSFVLWVSDALGEEEPKGLKSPRGRETSAIWKRKTSTTTTTQGRETSIIWERKTTA